MLGAIIGDLAGSIYEYKQIKNCKPIKVGKIIEPKAFFSDDTILTIAIMDAALHNKDYEQKLKEYAIKYENYKPNFEPYFEKVFSPNFLKWSKSSEIGTSAGNGAMMRISSIGWLFNTEEDIKENARLATIPSHNSAEAIKYAEMVALIIFYARQGLTKPEIIKKLKLKIVKPQITRFNYTCNETIDVVLYSIFTTESFKDAIKKAISFGGDTDTNACIVGSIAEAFYGIDYELKNQAMSYVPENFKIILQKTYSLVSK